MQADKAVEAARQYAEAANAPKTVSVVETASPKAKRALVIARSAEKAAEKKAAVKDRDAKLAACKGARQGVGGWTSAKDAREAQREAKRSSRRAKEEAARFERAAQDRVVEVVEGQQGVEKGETGKTGEGGGEGGDNTGKKVKVSIRARTPKSAHQKTRAAGKFVGGDDTPGDPCAQPHPHRFDDAAQQCFDEGGRPFLNMEEERAFKMEMRRESELDRRKMEDEELMRDEDRRGYKLRAMTNRMTSF